MWIPRVSFGWLEHWRATLRRSSVDCPHFVSDLLLFIVLRNFDAHIAETYSCTENRNEIHRKESYLEMPRKMSFIYPIQSCHLHLRCAFTAPLIKYACRMRRSGWSNSSIRLITTYKVVEAARSKLALYFYIRRLLRPYSFVQLCWLIVCSSLFCWLFPGMCSV